MALDGKIPTSKETFHRQDLGQPFSSPESRLTPDILDSCIEPWLPQAPLRVFDKSALLGRQPGSVVYLSMPANLLAESLADCLMDADWEYQPMEILQASPEPPPWAAE